MSFLIGFSGQGQQYAGMFRLLKQDPWGSDWLRHASELLKLDLFNETIIAEKCYDVLYSQLLITILSVGLYRAVTQQHPIQALLCGYSLGEVNAFFASTEISLESMCDIVTKRVQCMQSALKEHQPAGMVALKGHINSSKVNELTQNYHCYVAIVNGEDHYTVAGYLPDLDELSLAAKQAGVSQVKSLAVKLPSHTPLLAQASIIFLAYLQEHCSKANMTVPVLNALTGELIQDTPTMLNLLAKELSHTLQWDKVRQIACEYQPDLWLELGPKRELTNMLVATNPNIRAYAADDFATMDGLVNKLFY